MPLTRVQIDQKLMDIERQVPALLQDKNTFPRLFEDQVEILLGQLPATDRAHALAQLDAIVERSGYNR